MRKLVWKQDGSDLMEEAEILPRVNNHRWGKKAHKQEVHNAFKATNSETESEVEKEKKLHTVMMIPSKP
jgi:hypothetical protein